VTTGCGIFDRSSWGRLVLSGADRARFLNGQVTCAVNDLQPGRGTYGFITTIKGRVEAEIVVLATESELWLDLPPGRAQAVRGRLEKYVIVDRVEFTEPDGAVWTLLGPRSLELVAQAAGCAPEHLPTAGWEHRLVDIAGRSVRLVHEPKHAAATGGAHGVSLWLDRADAPEVRQTLSALGAIPVGQEVWHRHRVEQGRPLWGVDFGEDTFPQETGLEDAVSYTKGCYLGQEVVARIHYRGGVQRHMRRLVLDRPSEPGAELVLDGKPVGKLTSVAQSLAGDAILGLAVVHQRAEIGVELEVRLGDDGTVTSHARVAQL
jgi:aminomethyltransferase